LKTETKNYRAFDLNVWYPEEYTEETGTTWSDCLSIQGYVYIEDDLGSRKIEGDVINLTLEETRCIAPDFPEAEYGSDWWIGLGEFLKQAKVIPQRLSEWFESFGDINKIDADMEPVAWISKAS